MTPEAQKRQADRRAYNAVHQWDGPETRPARRALHLWAGRRPAHAAPKATTVTFRLSRAQGYVGVLQEMIHDTRMIPTDGRPATCRKMSISGSAARGHWEGDKLVVETTNYHR